MLTINTCVLTLKIKNSNKVVRYHKNYVDEEIAEKDQVEEAIKTKQNAEYTLTAITCVPILKYKTPNKYKYIKNNHTVSKKIGVQVDIERAETEVNKNVKSQNAGSAALTAIKTAKNKIDELVARDKFERTETETLNASTFIIIQNKPAESKQIAEEFIIIKNKSADSKRIAEKFIIASESTKDCCGVFIEGAETEEIDNNTHHPPEHPQDQCAPAD